MNQYSEQVNTDTAFQRVFIFRRGGGGINKIILYICFHTVRNPKNTECKKNNEKKKKKKKEDRKIGEKEREKGLGDGISLFIPIYTLLTPPPTPLQVKKCQK